MPKRAWISLRNDATVLYRSFILAVAVVLSIALVITVFVFRSGTAWNYYDFLFGPLLYIGGYIYTAGMFSDVHHQLKGSYYLLVPASITEKFVSRLVISGLLYVIGITLAVSVFSYLIYFLAKGTSGAYLPVFSPFRPKIIKSCGIYLVTQSLFLFGSTLFRKHAFLKTFLVIIGFLIAFSIIQGIVGAFVLRENQSVQISITIDELVQFIESVAPVFKIIFWFVMAPIFWLLSVWRLRGIQK